MNLSDEAERDRKSLRMLAESINRNAESISDLPFLLSNFKSFHPNINPIESIVKALIHYTEENKE